MSEQKVRQISPGMCPIRGLRDLADRLERGECPDVECVTVVTSEEEVYCFGPDERVKIPEVMFDLDRAKLILHEIWSEG